MTLLTNVLGNLLSNAAKFSPPGGEITLSSRKGKAGYIIIEMSDQVIGIPEDLKSKLFSMHEKTSRIGTSGEKGIGFGMPVVKKFVDLYHGSIESISNRNRTRGPTGTTFRLEIPNLALQT